MFRLIAILSILSTLLGVSLNAWAVVNPKKKAKKKLRVIDIRGFGDSGFIGGNHQFHRPEEWAIEQKLLRVAPLRSPHVNFVNLEGTLVSECERFASKRYSFVMAPEVLLSFARAGFNMFGLANNHSRDCQMPSPEQEFAKINRFLRKMAPKTIWHGSASEPRELWQSIPILVVRGVRIGMVAIKAWENDVATSVGNLTNRHQIFQALKEAKVDLRVLSLHGGEENKHVPTDLMIDIAREFVGIYDGDIVFGHHSHTIQGFEMLQKKDGRVASVFYSLGNFLHDGLSSRGEGMMAQVKATKRGVMPHSVQVFPLNSESELPGPANSKDLRRARDIWRRSNRSIAARPLPRGTGLRRLSWELTPVQIPALGLRVKTGGFKVQGGRSAARRGS